MGGVFRISVSSTLISSSMTKRPVFELVFLITLIIIHLYYTISLEQFRFAETVNRSFPGRLFACGFELAGNERPQPVSEIV